MSGLFGSSPSDFYGSQNYIQQFGNPQYNKLSYNGAIGGDTGPTKQNYQDTANTLMSGQLTPAQQQQINQQFGQNLAQTREGAFGMPIGAQKGLEMQGANQNALNAALLGTQNMNTGLNAGMNLMSLGQSNQQFGANFGAEQNAYGFGQQQAQNRFLGGLDQTAMNKAADNPGVLGGLVGSVAQFGLGKLFGTSNIPSMGTSQFNPNGFGDEDLQNLNFNQFGSNVGNYNRNYFE